MTSIFSVASEKYYIKTFIVMSKTYKYFLISITISSIVFINKYNKKAADICRIDRC